MTALPEIKKHLQLRRELEQRRRAVQTMFDRLDNIDRALEDYMDDQPRRADCIWPRTVDLLDVDAVKNQLGRETLSTRSYAAMIPSFVATWREQRQAALLKLLPGIQPSRTNLFLSSLLATRSRAPQPSPLSLPQAIFWCTLCEELVSGPQAMQHTCCYDHAPDWEAIHTDATPWVDGAYSPLVMEGGDMLARACVVHARGLSPWDPAGLRGCSDIVRNIWSSMGLDATASDVAAKADGVRVACSACVIPGKVMVAMGWRRAVR